MLLKYRGHSQEGVRQERSINMCPFCNPTTSEILLHGYNCYARKDLYPVTEGHVLVCCQRHVKDYRSLSQATINAMWSLVDKVIGKLQDEDSSITGFNLGVNCGEDAGQTIPHVHIHVIPRRSGDMSDPTGGCSRGNTRQT